MKTQFTPQFTAQFMPTLGLCMRAGKLVFGLDTVRAAAKEGKAALIITASDLSEKSAKEAAFAAEKFSLSYLALPMTMEDFRRAIGKKTGVAAVCDEGFAAKLLTLYEE